jgi:hypothetical protein
LHSPFPGLSWREIVDVLKAWEEWTGPSEKFHQELGLKSSQVGSLIKKGKKLMKQGIISSGEFKELGLESIIAGTPNMIGPIEVL